jgi:hypothetical protein
MRKGKEGVRVCMKIDFCHTLVKTRTACRERGSSAVSPLKKRQVLNFTLELHV